MNPNQQIDGTESHSQTQELQRPRWHYTETYSKSLQDCMDDVVAQAGNGLVRGIWAFGRFW